MDNDLMARRLRPPSQPNSSNGPSNGPGNGPSSQQPTSPWDVPLTTEIDFAPPDPGVPPQDPPFFPPDPSARADVPWDRPAPEAWPPTDDSAANSEPPIWSSQGALPDNTGTRPDWPAADNLGEVASDAAPWDRPAAEPGAQWQDPDDALAPVVGDVAGPVAWASWNGSDNGDANGSSHANGYADGNGTIANSSSMGGGNFIRYASAQTPEPMAVTAHGDRPTNDERPPNDERPTNDEPLDTAASTPYPEWPAEDDLTAPPSSTGPVVPEDSWPATPQSAAPTPVAPASSQSEPEPPAWLEPDQEEPHAEVPTTPTQPVEPEPTTPLVELSTPPNTHFVAVTPSGTSQNMVLRIELAIIDESQRANPADSAKRVGPEADVRTPEFEPRKSGDPEAMPEPEYVWDAPPPDQKDQQRPQNEPHWPPRQEQPAPPPAFPMPQSAQHYAPPPSSWLPAPQQPQDPLNAQSLDWDLPEVGGHQPPIADPPAPWSTPQQGQPAKQPYAPPPTWAMTQPAPSYEPEPAQYMAPPAPQRQQPAPQQQPPAPAAVWTQPPAPQYPSAAPWQQPQQPNEPAAPHWPPQRPDPLAGMPAAPQYQPQYATQAVQPVQSAPTGGVAADQADLWFLNNQPAAATVVNDEVQTEGKSNSLLTAVLTICFALLVIVLVLVFIQLMTSLLR